VVTKCVAIAEPGLEVLIEMLRHGVTSMLLRNRVLYFIEIIKNIRYKHMREMSVLNRLCFYLQTLDPG
jgi:hypothetical protein